MKTFLFLLCLSLSLQTYAALPPQFSECLSQNSAANMTAADVAEIAKVSRITYCQNQVSIIGKTDLQTMLANPNVNVGVSVSKTSYSSQDLLEMAGTGTYVLYVDGGRLSRDNLVSLLNAGVQVVIRTSQAGLSRQDILDVAQLNTEKVSIFP